MRIVAGEMRGRPIQAPPGRATRPTSDRVREAIFSIVGPVEGLAVLDVFAGSGALGLEALSRGADHAVFVDDDPRAAAVIHGNAERLGVADRVRVVRRDWRRALAGERSAGRRYGLCLADPPYSFLSRIADELGRAIRPLMDRGGILVVEGPTGPDTLALADLAVEHRTDRTYGSTRVTVARLGAAGERR
jgi:16S rRNA (guanine966-N2)-methyltransferase